MFSVGQQVVCIDDKFEADMVRHYVALPKEGTTYTVRSVKVCREQLKASDSATVGVLMRELVNPLDPTHKDHEELAFKAERFRALDEYEQTTQEKIGQSNPTAHYDLQPESCGACAD